MKDNATIIKKRRIRHVVCRISHMACRRNIQWLLILPYAICHMLYAAVQAQAGYNPNWSTLSASGSETISGDWTFSGEADFATVTVTSDLTVSGTIYGTLGAGTVDTAANYSWTGAHDFASVTVSNAVTVDGVIVSTNECVGLDCSSKGRIEFEDEGTDNINLMGANVGIGMTEPGSLLIVAGNVGIGVSAVTSGATLHVQNDDQGADDHYAILVDDQTSNQWNYGVKVDFDSTDAEHSYGYYADISGGTTANYAFYAHAGESYFADNIGIGYADPGSKLVVNGSVGIGSSVGWYKLDVASGGTDDVARFYSSDDLAQIRLQDNDTTAYVGSKDSKAFIGVSSGMSTNNLVVTSAGNVGIGITVPVYRLDVYDAADGTIRQDAYGIRAQAISQGAPGIAYGVYASAVDAGDETGVNYAVYATASGSGTNHALYAAAGTCYDGSSGACSLNDIAEFWHSEKTLAQKMCRPKAKDEGGGVTCSLPDNFEKEFHDGDVVCNAGGEKNVIRACHDAYDREAISVISEQSTIVMGGDFGAPYPVSLAGNAPVNVICDDPIEPGDLLVYSGEGHYAMKLKIEPDDTVAVFYRKMQGVIGKALDHCERGKKKIRMWL